MALNRQIVTGKARHFETDRDMHKYWDQYQELKQHFDAVFEEWICKAPEQLQEIHDEMDILVKKVCNSSINIRTEF